jgi:hypothetical protein
LLQLELHQTLKCNNIILVTKATKMSSTKLTYRGIAYIKKDTGRYEIDSLTRNSYLDEDKIVAKKSLASV